MDDCARLRAALERAAEDLKMASVMLGDAERPAAEDWAIKRAKAAEAAAKAAPEAEGLWAVGDAGSAEAPAGVAGFNPAETDGFRVKAFFIGETDADVLYPKADRVELTPGYKLVIERA